jgi:hypothetical protein
MDTILKLVVDNNGNYQWLPISLAIVAFISLTAIVCLIKHLYDVRLEIIKHDLGKGKKGLSEVQSLKKEWSAQVKEIDSLNRVPSFPAPSDITDTPRRGNRFLSFGPEEIILGDLSFHILKAYGNFNSQNAAMSVDMVCHYCQLKTEEALPAVKQLHGLGFIKTVVNAPGEWNGHYQITAIGRDYIRRHGN